MKKIFTLLLFAALASTTWAQNRNVLNELKADPRKAYGTDYPYKFENAQMTKAPKGYKAFYISHYGRHGSRYYWNAQLYSELANLLNTANEKNLLTAEGKGFLQQVHGCKRRIADGRERTERPRMGTAPAHCTRHVQLFP